MSDLNFHYNVVPSGVNVSTRVSPQEDLTQDEIVDAVATSTSLTAAQVTSVGTALLQQLILGAKVSRKVRRLFGLLSFSPSCGGVHTDPDFQPTAENMNLSLNCALAPDGHVLFENGITFQRDEVMGTRAPMIDRVYDGASHALNRCTAGGAFRIGGHDFGLEPGTTDLLRGVFLAPVAGGAAVRVASYSDWTGTQIMGSWPSPITGAQVLSVVTNYSAGGTNRTGIFGTHLTP
ncbi:MAG TPA: hypothetical protein VGG02_03705 [Chthoniobacterales bacterium]|jgi:hypothetical protein